MDSTIGTGLGGVFKTGQVAVSGGNFGGVTSKTLAEIGQTGGVSAVYAFTTSFVAGDDGIQTILRTNGPGTDISAGFR